MGDASKNPKQLEAVVEELAPITGQRPVVTKAKKAIANFGLREGMPVGAAVTLRGARMYEFLDRFIIVAIPRIRDFRGLPSRSFDGRGNYTFGVKEQMIFPEIDYDKVEKIHGMDITFVTTTDRDDLAMALLRELGWPFRGETPASEQAARLSREETTWRRPPGSRRPSARRSSRSAHSRCQRCGRSRARAAQVRPVPHLFP